MKLIVIIIVLSFGFGGELKARQLSADSVLAIASDFKDQGNYPQANIHYQEARDLYLQAGDSVNWLNTSILLGRTMGTVGEMKEAQNLYKELSQVQLQNIPVDLSSRIQNGIGWTYERLQDPVSAKKYYVKGLEIAEESGDSALIARLSNSISYTFKSAGDYDTALSYQLKAKKIYEELNKPSNLSAVLNQIFLTMMALELYDLAEPYVRESLEISKKLEDLHMLDIGYHNLGWNFERRGNRDSAIINYNKSLELSRRLNKPFDITQTLSNIGTLYEKSGDYEQALLFLNEALEVNRTTERPVSISLSLIKIGRIAMKNNDLATAEEFFKEARSLLDESTAPRTLTSVYLEYARLELLKKEYESSKEFIAKAYKISEEKNFESERLYAFNTLGEVYLAEGKLTESLNEYRKAYTLSSGYSRKIYTIVDFARAHYMSSSDSAFILADEAFELIDERRTSVAGLSFRAGLFRGNAGFYNEVAEWYLSRKNDSEKAFELIESAKARVLMDELAERQERIYEKEDESTYIRKQQISKKIDRLYNQVSVAKSDEEKQALRDEVKDLEFQYQELVNKLNADAKIPDFEYPEPASLQSITEMLDEDTGILEYAFADEKLIRFFITEAKTSAVVIDSVEGESAKSFLENFVRNFRDSLLTPQRTADFSSFGEKLHQVLIPAQEAKNLGISNIIVVPDGALSFLPFEALSSGESYLIEDFNLKYLPSSSVYSFIKDPHRATTSELLAIAGSGFEGNSDSDPTRSGVSFASLPSTLLEVESISSNFQHPVVLKNEEVSETSLKSFDLKNYRFLHFATHGVIDEEKPSRSGLLLSTKEETESLFTEDGFLNSNEIAEMNLNADLVTLSACNTGMGKIITGEGLLGLQHSFLSAGASSVIVSLWNVYDRSTSEIMSRFYKDMLVLEKEEFGLWNSSLKWLGMYNHPLFDYKAKALRSAKLAMIEHPYYNHPVHWAPFILIGK